MCLTVPGKVTRVEAGAAGLTMGTVDFGGVTRRVCLDYLPEVHVGDHVVVSLGFAVRVIDAAEAAEAYEALSRIRDLSELDLPAGRTPVGEQESA